MVSTTWRRAARRFTHTSVAAGGAVMVLSLVVVVAFQLVSMRAPLLDTDEAVYASVAALMNAGGTLYVDGGIDNKPPVIFWTYALVFRATGTYNMLAVHALKIGVVLATALAMFFIARRRASVQAGAIAFGLYGVFTAAGYPPMGAANAEVFMMLPVALAVLAASSSAWWLAGALITVAAFTKQTAVLDLVVLVVATTGLRDTRQIWRATVSWMSGLTGACAVMVGVLWWLAGALITVAAFTKQTAVLDLVVLVVATTGLRDTRQIWRATVWWMSGLTGACAVMVGVLWWQHSAFGFWRWAVLSLPGYGANAWLAHRWESLYQNSVQPWLLTVPLLWVPTAVALVRRLVKGAGGDRILWAWLVVSWVQVVSSGQFFGHYFITVVGPLSVLAAIEVDAWLRGPRIQVLATAAAGLVLATPALASISSDYQDRGELSPESMQVGEYVRAHTTGSDRILVYGNDATLYVASDRLPSTAMVGFLRGYPRGALRKAGVSPDNWDTAPDAWAQFDEDQANHPAALILDAATRDADFRDYQLADTFPILARVVQDHYRMVAVVAGVTIYERIPDSDRR